MKEEIRLSDHFSYKKLFRFTIPSVIMMMFSSVYSVVDGLFVSNFAGKTQFAAVNFIFPFIMILTTGGFMLGSGGAALISKTLGEGNSKKANNIFSMIVYFTMGLSIVIALAGFFCVRNVAELLGAEGEMLEGAVTYYRWLTPGIIAWFFQYEFQILLSTAEKPKLALIFTVVSGVSNMILDALFVGLFKWGIAGAAAASSIGAMISGFGPLIYFILPNNSLLRLGKPWFGGKEMLKICTNGSSELMSNISMSLVGMLYNVQLLKYAGENGVAAYGVLMYVNMIFIAIFIGYSMGTSPIVGYHFGAGDTDELKSILKKSAVIIGLTSVAMAVFSLIMARPLSNIFTSYDADLCDMTVHGFYIYSFSFLFAGTAIFGSGFFTALNNGLVSAIISFLRTLVFQVLAVMLLPLVLGLDGIWYSIVVAEIAAAILCIVCIILNRKKYRYY